MAQRAFKGPQEPSNLPLNILAQPRILTRDQHSVSRKDISEAALKVLYRLHNAGFQAYLVGGCVRYLLLGLHPKDFDVTTNATPEQIRKLFRNCRLVGRRFRLAHVVFGREIIEVATFRGHHDSADSDDSIKVGKQDAEGMLLRDNVYGSIEEDAQRRDFTINALYYNVTRGTIHDYVNGVQDIRNQRVRLIGNPVQRYQEDPVRMLRAVRFAAKLDFEIEPHTAAPIAELAELLYDIPAARLFDEVLKLFLGGQGERTFDLLLEYDLFAPLFPDTDEAIDEQPEYTLKLIRQALRNTDQRINEGRPVTPAFLFAALLWPALPQRTRE